MNNSKTRGKINQAAAGKIVFAQLFASLVIAVVLWWLFDGKVAYSALLGGGICVAGTLLFAGIMFGRETMTPAQMVLAMYIGEAAKIVLTVAGFIAAFLLVDLNAAVFILAYMTVLTLNWFAFLLLNK